ncbi:RNA ligase RtcB family protein [Enterovibrio baiacu]|uniref:RNA ligase RtcB family protein n=1 Tax=Enterovibrio baiacu TaxID=2491023 RepID=UPI0010102E99|nr:RNA ligase RtcB family protein [Enterovibrio baiacu]MBE1273722.1 RNA ligase RtcB family protein [Enterovibrio baiacu]
MDKSVQILTEKVSLFASECTWIEGLAIQQLIKTSELAGMIAVAGMPDLHPGRGYPIGAAFFSDTKVYPALVGNDIGCGMALWQSSLNVAKVNVDKLAKKLQHVESELDESWQPLVHRRKTEKQISDSLFDAALGTIGGGNHFAEFQAVDEVYDASEMEQLNIDRRKLLLLAHSGSRGLGQSILVGHIAEHNHQGLAVNSPEHSTYMQAHDEAVRWAELNRELIARRFFDAINVSGECVLDVNHNFIEKSTLLGDEQKAGWLHRKGATPSDKGYVVIPGSRGDYSYLVKPTEMMGKQQGLALFSLAHGAGRKWKRGECQARLSHKYKKDDLYKTSLGSKVICGDKGLLYDEAPQAYKRCDSIIDDLINAGLITLVARLRPVLTFKTQGGCSA